LTLTAGVPHPRVFRKGRNPDCELLGILTSGTTQEIRGRPQPHGIPPFRKGAKGWAIISRDAEVVDSCLAIVDGFDMSG